MKCRKEAGKGNLFLKITIMIIVFLPVVLFSQPADIPFHRQSYYFHSGFHQGNQISGQIEQVYSTVVKVNSAPWLQLQFSDFYLGEFSHIVITSLKDGERQRHNGTTLAQWQLTSAYFNGDAVRIDLYAAPGENGIFVELAEVIVGEWVGGIPTESQCGPTDDRLPSSDPAVGRLMNVGCTGWIIVNSRLITAGHCAGGSANIMEFNVPMSLPNGTIQHPGPEDQYAVNSASMISVSGGVGNDWGVFECFDNPNTGLQPIAAQGTAFMLAQDLGPDSIRITGHGVDNNTPQWNQVQQTHIGPNAGSSGTTMRYVTDTEPGNSGSPVIDGATHLAVGVHTHGGCTISGGNNNGTSTFNAAFWAAIGPLLAVPDAPFNFSAYSDYITPTGMHLTWNDPAHSTSGDTLLPGEFSIHIERDGIWVDSVQGGIGEYMDGGLNDGQEYMYEIYAIIDSTGMESERVQASWIAGGSPVPLPPVQVNISNGIGEVKFNWINPTANIDGTPMDDLAGINLYMDNNPVATFNRVSADTGKLDSAIYTTTATGFHQWHLTAIDNESPQNESGPSNTVLTPLDAPIGDLFAEMGTPDPLMWDNDDADINDRSVNPPSAPYALNFNGKPDGGDVVELHPTDLLGFAGSGIIFSYYYQPQGQGNAPEHGDSLLIYFRNNLDSWVLVNFHNGTTLQDFQQVIIDLDTAPNGGGTFFHSQFQIRLRSVGGASMISINDDWFVDNTFLGLPAPFIASSTDSVQFDSTHVDSSEVIPINIYNIGHAQLDVSSVISTNTNFSVDVSSFSIAPDSSQNINISFAPLNAGVHSGMIRLASNDPNQDTLDIYVNGTAFGISGIEAGLTIPQEYAVSQNYPNPFNPSTTIKYQLPNAVNVHLVIYNVLGQKVRTLLNKHMAAGYHEMIWDGRTDQGFTLPTGVYIYRFEAGNFKNIRKMLLMK